jgi:hypothetical protein
MPLLGGYAVRQFGLIALTCLLSFPAFGQETDEGDGDTSAEIAPPPTLISHDNEISVFDRGTTLSSIGPKIVKRNDAARKVFNASSNFTLAGGIADIGSTIYFRTQPEISTPTHLYRRDPQYGLLNLGVQTYRNMPEGGECRVFGPRNTAATIVCLTAEYAGWYLLSHRLYDIIDRHRKLKPLKYILIGTNFFFGAASFRQAGINVGRGIDYARAFRNIVPVEQ